MRGRPTWEMIVDEGNISQACTCTDKAGSTLYKQQIKIATVLTTTGGVTVLATTVGVTETMDSTGGGQSSWVSAVQLDKTTMETIIAGVAAQLQVKEGESSSTEGKSNSEESSTLPARLQLLSAVKLKGKRGNSYQARKGISGIVVAGAEQGTANKQGAGN